MTQIFSEGTIPARTIAGGGARTHTILRSLDFESSASASSATPAKRIVKLRCQRRSSRASNEIERLQTSRWSKNFAKNDRVAQQSWLELGLRLSRGFSRANNLRCGRASR